MCCSRDQKQAARSVKQITTVSLEIERQNVIMEIDTGATASLISGERYHRRWPGVAISATNFLLRTYTGEQLEVLGARKVEVQYGQQQATLPLVVVAKIGPCLLGRDWLQHLRLDCTSICHTRMKTSRRC